MSRIIGITCTECGQYFERMWRRKHIWRCPARRCRHALLVFGDGPPHRRRIKRPVRWRQIKPLRDVRLRWEQTAQQRMLAKARAEGLPFVERSGGHAATLDAGDKTLIMSGGKIFGFERRAMQYQYLTGPPCERLW